MTIEDYIHQFASLNTNKYHGYEAPHKPIMLLSIIDLVEAGEINGNCFGMSENLEKKFYENWLRYVGASIVFKPMPATPFYHLSSEPFWKLYNSAGVQINKLQSTPSAAYLRNNKISATIDDDLFTLLKSTENRARLRTLLISTYFSKN